MGSSLGELADSTQYDLDYFRGDTIAVDGYIVLYQFLTGIRDSQTGDYIRNDDEEPISHLIGLLNRMSTVVDHDIDPIFVFDGGYPDLKEDLVEERGEEKAEAREKYAQAQAAGDYEAMQEWGRKKVGITSDILESTQDLLDAMGIPVIWSPTEGEPQAAQLVKDGLADHVVSEDYDTLMYRAPTMVRQFSGDGGEVLSYQQMLDSTGYSPEEVLWYGILRGTDYNESPHGVGGVRGRNIIDRCDCFQDVIDAALEWDASINPDRWWEVKEWFEDPDVERNPEIPDTRFEPYAIRNVLVNDYGMLASQVDSKLRSMNSIEYE